MIQTSFLVRQNNTTWRSTSRLPHRTGGKIDHQRTIQCTVHEVVGVTEKAGTSLRRPVSLGVSLTVLFSLSKMQYRSRKCTLTLSSRHSGFVGARKTAFYWVSWSFSRPRAHLCTQWSTVSTLARPHLLCPVLVNPARAATPIFLKSASVCCCDQPVREANKLRYLNQWI